MSFATVATKVRDLISQTAAFRSAERETDVSPAMRPPQGSNDSARRRLYLLATVLVTRGMQPKDAYETAMYYVYGPGRGRSWIRAIGDLDGLELI